MRLITADRRSAASLDVQLSSKVIETHYGQAGEFDEYRFYSHDLAFSANESENPQSEAE
jgi:hypothetical protein